MQLICVCEVLWNWIKGTVKQAIALHCHFESLGTLESQVRRLVAHEALYCGNS